MDYRKVPWPALGRIVAALALAGGGFGAGAAAERSGALPGAIVREPAGVESTFSIFWQAWDLVQQRYVERQAIDQTQMTYGAVEGMLDALGDTGHTRFLSPKELQDFQASLAGRLEGIGAEVGMRNGRPTIIAPIPGSPAQRAGLRPGDVIVRVDGREVSGLKVDQVVDLVRGPAGSPVTLTVIHPDQGGLTDVTVTRARITVPSVSWARVPGTAVAHVLISQFAERTTDDLVGALNEARSGGATAIVLDLRNDPGGLRDEAIGAASQFLGEGNVLIERDAQGHETPFPVRAGGVATDVPLAALINEGTASSAEILAGALQDRHRGPLIGATTVGTGTVLSLYHLSDGSAVFLGTSEWLTPDGRQIWHHGITPDVPVALPPGAFPLIPNEESGLSPEQLQASQDAPLLRALQELGQAAAGR